MLIKVLPCGTIYMGGIIWKLKYVVDASKKNQLASFTETHRTGTGRSANLATGIQTGNIIERNMGEATKGNMQRDPKLGNAQGKTKLNIAGDQKLELRTWHVGIQTMK